MFHRLRNRLGRGCGERAGSGIGGSDGLVRDGSCLINYFVGDSSSFALAIGPEQLYFYQIEQASPHLEQVHHFHQSLSLPARRTLGPADYEAYET
ncbi:MAG: hypothetical protein AAFV25_12785, partial [Bacteroidota bacterium]